MSGSESVDYGETRSPGMGNLGSDGRPRALSRGPGRQPNVSAHLGGSTECAHSEAGFTGGGFLRSSFGKRGRTEMGREEEGEPYFLHSWGERLG